MKNIKNFLRKALMRSWSMRTPSSYQFHSFWVPSVCVHAKVAVAILELLRTTQKCANLYYSSQKHYNKFWKPSPSSSINALALFITFIVFFFKVNFEGQCEQVQCKLDLGPSVCADCWYTIRSVTLPTQYNHLYQIILFLHYTKRSWSRTSNFNRCDNRSSDLRRWRFFMLGHALERQSLRTITDSVPLWTARI